MRKKINSRQNFHKRWKLVVASFLIISVVLSSCSVKVDNENKTVATVEQLQEAQAFISEKIQSLDQQRTLPEDKVQHERDRQEWLSRAYCVQGLIEKRVEIESQQVCQSVLKEVSDGKLKRAGADISSLFSKNSSALFIVGAVVILLIFVLTRMV